MKFFFVISFIFAIIACDTMPVRPPVGSCVKHWWIKGIYKMQSVENLKIKLESVSGGEVRIISQLDRGWSEVKCP